MKSKRDTDDPYSSDSDMLESLSSLVFSLWKTRKLHINTDFSVTGWILCVIPRIFKDAKYHSDIYNRKQANNLINTFLVDYQRMTFILLKTYFGLSTLNSITRLVHLTGMNLPGK